MPIECPESLASGLPQPGTLITEKYEVERVLGAGGMGVVVAARHLELGQRVAIKFMRADAAEDPSGVERFLREARAAVALTSEHVARVLDVGRLDTGEPYMVMEYLAGSDLGQVLRRDGPMSVPAAVGVVLQASEAIAEAHARGIVHRDPKPANLFIASRVDGSPLVKVLDFGISKALRGDAPQGPSLTMSGMVMGSPGYMSPEQVRSTKDVDSRSDIWSIGVILYELLTAVSPFQGETLGDTFAKITSESPPPIRKLRPDVPEGLATTIERCLDRDLKGRIQTVADLAARLLPFAPSESAVAAARILRISALGGGSTMTAPEGAPNARAPAGRTENSWLRSAPHPGRSRAGRVAATIAGLALIGAAAAGYWTLTRLPGAIRQPQAGASHAAPVPTASSAPEVLAPARPAAALLQSPASRSTGETAASAIPEVARDAGRASILPPPTPPGRRTTERPRPSPSTTQSATPPPNDNDIF